MDKTFQNEIKVQSPRGGLKGQITTLFGLLLAALLLSPLFAVLYFKLFPVFLILVGLFIGMLALNIKDIINSKIITVSEKLLKIKYSLPLKKEEEFSFSECIGYFPYERTSMTPNFITGSSRNSYRMNGKNYITLIEKGVVIAIKDKMIKLSSGFNGGAFEGDNADIQNIIVILDTKGVKNVNPNPYLNKNPLHIIQPNVNKLARRAFSKDKIN